jgi:TRAP-type C4-dicarboxylate transport system substrate-binding protein
VKEQRDMVKQVELDAARTLQENGIQAFSPDEAARTEARKKLSQSQDALVKAMKIDAEAEQLAKQELQAANVDF